MIRHNYLRCVHIAAACNPPAILPHTCLFPFACAPRYPGLHFSLYFTHWDRWCGTLHPTYDAALFTYFTPSSKQPQQPPPQQQQRQEQEHSRNSIKQEASR
jgi:hypothetical protein